MSPKKYADREAYNQAITGKMQELEPAPCQVRSYMCYTSLFLQCSPSPAAGGKWQAQESFPSPDIREGDVLVGIASSGVHSNGFSLVRSVFEMTRESLDTYYDELGSTLGEALITPTKIYVKALKAIKDAGVVIKGCSHITGGGLALFFLL